MENINESGLSRLYDSMLKHDCGIITAFRGYKWKIDPKTEKEIPEQGESYTYRENMQRSKSLSAKLQYKGFGITKVSGVFVENYNTEEANPVKELSYFVVDYKNKGNLRSVLISLGEEFSQDSVLFIPVGGDSAELVGTQKIAPDTFPGYGSVFKFDKRELGVGGEFMTLKGGRPFRFNTVEESVSMVQNTLGMWGVSLVAKKPWNELVLVDKDLDLINKLK